MVSSARWVPQVLTDVQKANRAETPASLLTLFNENPDNFFISRFVTVDETWLHHFDPESKAQSMAWKYVTSPPPSVFASAQSHGHRILGFWRNCTVWLSGTWQNYYRNMPRWTNRKMSSGTEKEDMRKVATRCVVSSGQQCPCSYIITSTDCHSKCMFELLRHPSYLSDLAPSDFCFQNWRNSWKDENLLMVMMLPALRVTGWRTKIKNSSTMEYRLWRIAGPSAFLLKGTMLKSDKISVSYSVVNCIRLWTFWPPLVQLDTVIGFYHHRRKYYKVKVSQWQSFTSKLWVS